LAESPHRVAQAVFGPPIGVQEEDVNIRMGKQRAPAKASQRHQGKFLDRPREMSSPTAAGGFSTSSVRCAIAAVPLPVAVTLLNACRFSEIEVAEFSA
jgi:hypothetical protein